MIVHYLATLCLGLYLGAAILFLLQVVNSSIKTSIRPRLLLFLGLVTHSFLVVPFIGSMQEVLPGSRSEYLFWLSWLLVGLYFIAGKKADYPVFGAFVAPLSAAFLTGSSYLAHQVNTEKIVVNDFMLAFAHVAPALLAELCLVVAFVLSWIFLIQEKRLRQKKLASRAFFGPSLDTLGSLNQKVLFIGFVFMTFAVLSGVLWAFSEHIPVLSNDFYQWVAILVWLCLGVMLHARLNLNWSAHKMARMTVFVTSSIIISISLMVLYFGNDIHGVYGF
jgi:ABC-type uncharacterized transport system permease subunit